MLLPLLLACQSDPARDFTQLHPGMEKNDVLEIMGSPHQTGRWHGMDRWTYIYYENVNRQEKEIHFTDGKAIYLGAKPAPTVSAEEQDRLFEVQNAELEKTWAAHREENKRSLKTFQDEVEGTHEIRYVPQFVPVQ